MAYCGVDFWLISSLDIFIKMNYLVTIIYFDEKGRYGQSIHIAGYPPGFTFL
jgi:hypothetical protein